MRGTRCSDGVSLPAAVRASIEESLRNAKYLRLYAGRKLNQQSFRLKISGLRWSKLPAALPGIALSDSSKCSFSQLQIR